MILTIFEVVVHNNHDDMGPLFHAGMGPLSHGDMGPLCHDDMGPLWHGDVCPDSHSLPSIQSNHHPDHILN